MSHPEVIINGQRDSQISSFDRGLAYGDGVFETIAVKQGKLIFWDDHLNRLIHGCDVLGIGGLDYNLLKSEVLSTISAKEDCVIKIIIARGVGGRGYKPEKNTHTRIIQKHPWPEHSEKLDQQEIEITQCAFRISRQSALSQIKHLNRLEQVLARSEWEDEFQDGLVCDTNENIIEGTSSNVFFECDNNLITPDLTHCGIEGVMRKKIIEYCLANKISLEIRDFKLSEINSIRGILLCNSIMGIRQVRTYCGRELDNTAIINRLITAFNH